MRHFPALLSLLARAALGQAACTDSRGTGSLAVSWIVGGPGCEDAGIDTVRLRLLEDGFDALQPPATAACTQGFEGLSVVDVPAGRFTLLAKDIASGASCRESVVIGDR